jgi:hypothetical protein
VTGIIVRVCRDGQWLILDAVELTKEERHEWLKDKSPEFLDAVDARLEEVIAEQNRILAVLDLYSQILEE